MGDSFTEGLWDTAPEDPEVQYGWADRLAFTLSGYRHEAGQEPLEYANLAIRGRLLESILTDQLPRALEQRPDLISIAGGGNDVLHLGCSPDRLAALLDGAVARVRATGTRVLLATGMDTRGLALLGALRHKIAIYNADLWSIAHRHGAAVIDLWGMRSLRDRRMWAEDRIHLSPEGHRRVAQAGLVALGLPPGDPGWELPRGPGETVASLAQLRDDAAWLRRDVYPWATRRLRRASTGDARRAKYPDLRLVEAAVDAPGRAGR
ncbi:SGNH/GDSL hydrolase family protein [Pseudactinotalea sp. HY160]|nr:SGNH/GDSL hydrolase family protein [Pseudactinotalea sp. HY160]QGH70887.1 SGNH/GDSL hydrolase family protein [Pseudactinotalea sp. HY158]